MKDISSKKVLKVEYFRADKCCKVVVLALNFLQNGMSSKEFFCVVVVRQQTVYFCTRAVHDDSLGSPYSEVTFRRCVFVIT